MESPVRSSCGNCRKAHKGCDRAGPPCGRCVEFELQSTCYFPQKIGQRLVKSPPPEPKPTPVKEKPKKREKPKSPVQNGEYAKPIEEKPMEDLKLHTYRILPFTKFMVVNLESDEETLESVEKEAENCNLIYGRKGMVPVKRSGKPHALPKASFREIDTDIDPEYKDQYSPFWEQPQDYVEYTERTNEELETVVEYDLDSEDEKWISDYNGKRCEQALPIITEDEFEKLIDRLEKESFKHESKDALPPPEDIDVENTNCCICDDGTSDDTNQIVFCDGCDIGVHQGSLSHNK